MPIVYANIGSNLGDRQTLIETAVSQIADTFGICCISQFIESEPWGFKSENRFLNLGVSFLTMMDYEEILAKLQKIEKSICNNSHRDNSGNYTDRMIDIDIMAIDEIVYESSRLIIPHPHLLERNFFLTPLKELCPEWQYPKI